METIKPKTNIEAPAIEPEKKEASIERVFLGKTKDGADVYDREDSHFHAEGGLTPELLSIAIGAIDTKGYTSIKKQVDFDYQIGYSTCVETGPNDDIVFAYRKTENGSRDGLTPMVKNREAKPSNSITVVLRKDDDMSGSYTMKTSYIGEISPREPWDPSIGSERELKESKEFWATHSLVYDDSLIDWEKTKAFEFMSEPAKKLELIRQKTLYAGLFVNPNELYSKAPSTLAKQIRYPHVTTNFKPGIQELHLDQLGSGAKIFAIGYGNDGKNEGLLVKVEADDPVIQQACDALETPHITLSISKNGQAKDTAFLKFSPLEKPFEITGKYNIYVQGAPREKLENLPETQVL